MDVLVGLCHITTPPLLPHLHQTTFTTPPPPPPPHYTISPLLALIHTSPRQPSARTNSEKEGTAWGDQGGEGGRQRTIIDQHLFSLHGTAHPWAPLIAGPDSPLGDLITYKFMKELFAVLTVTLRIYNVMPGPRTGQARCCN